MSKRVQELFFRCLRLRDPTAQTAFLDETCGGDSDLRRRLGLLLSAHDPEDPFLECPAAEVCGAEAFLTEFEGTGELIGPYKLLEQIGEGGMGVVYRAEQQAPVRREVALKVIKPGMDTRDVVARFEVERESLAMMDHPNIAKVLGAGTTESGRPYFVMELVPGVPITKYADQNELITQQRLELFVAVCEAVQHAHQKGVIHRDIKPANVLVATANDVPTPKVIDFGIAKAMHRELTTAAVTTAFGQIMGTPMYMSPEQAGLGSSGVDTRTDIYSLGVMLYELLTGTTPFDEQRLREANYDEVRRLIREEEPLRPSSRISTLGKVATTVSMYRKTEPHKLSRLLRGELDWIVVKAIEKDRDRRYASAAAFARDIERYLNDEPVEACPPSRLYKFRKFAQRNKLALASSLIITTLIVAGTGIVAWQSVRVRRESENTEIARAKAEQLATLGVKVLDDIYLNVLGDRLARQQAVSAEQTKLLQAGLDYYKQFVAQSQDRADSDLAIGNAHRQVGLIYGRLGDREKEEEAYQRAIALYERLATRSPKEPEYEFRMALVLGSLLENQAALGHDDQARESGEKAIQILERLRGDLPNRSDYGMALAGMHNRLAWELGSVLSPSDVQRHHRTALHLFAELAERFPEARLERELPYDDPLDGVAHSRLQLANEIHDPDEVDQLRRAALNHFKAKVEVNPHSQWHRAQLAEVNMTLRANVREGLALWEELYSEYPGVPQNKHRLALGCIRLGKTLKDAPDEIGEAEQLLRRAVQLMTELVRDFPDTPVFQSDLAAALEGLMNLPRHVINLEEARRLIELAIQRQTNAVNVNPLDRSYRAHLADHYGNLALLLNELGDSSGVEGAYRTQIDLLEELSEEAPANFDIPLLRTKLKYADWLVTDGGYPEGERIYQDLIAECSARIGENREAQPDTISCLGTAFHGLAVVHLDRNELDNAKQALEQAIENQEKALSSHPDHHEYREQLCRHYCRLGSVLKRRDADNQSGTRAAWTTALDIFRQLRGQPSPVVQNAVAWMLIDGPEVWDTVTIRELAQEVLNRSPDSPEFWLALGVAEYRDGHWAESIASLERSNQLDGGNSCVLFFLAMANWQLGATQESFQWYEKADKWLDGIGPHMPELLEVRQQANQCIGSAIAIRSTERREGTGGATTDFTFIITRFGDTAGSVTVDWATADGTARAGTDYIPASGQFNLSGDVTENRITVPVYHDYIPEPSENFVVNLTDVTGATVAQRRALGNILNDDDTPSAKEWRDAVRIDPDCAVAHFKKGVTAWIDTRHREALTDLDRAITLAPDFALAYFNRGIAHHAVRDSIQAISDWSKAIELGFNRAEAYSNRGVCRATQGNLDEALIDFNRAIQIGPPRAEVFTNRGVILVGRGEMQEAISDFDWAIQIRPSFSLAHANRAITLARLGQVEQALEDIRQFAARTHSESGLSRETFEWIDIPDPHTQPFRRFRDEASKILGLTENFSTKKGNGNTQIKVAGEPTLTTTELTGPASLGRLVCTPKKMTLAIISQTLDLSQREYKAMLTAQMKKRLRNRQRKLRLEQLEHRNLLTLGSISGTLFEDLNADGVYDPSEPGLAGWTVVLEPANVSDPRLTLLNPDPDVIDGQAQGMDEFGWQVVPLGDHILVGAPLENGVDDQGGPILNVGAAYLFDGSSGALLETFTDPDPVIWDMFGVTVAAVGDKALIGTWRDWYREDRVPLQGAAYLFSVDLDPNTPPVLEHAFLDPNVELNPDPGPPPRDDRFGEGDLATYGSHVLIGDPKDDSAGAEAAGAVYMFDSTTGNHTWTFVSPTPNAHDRFGDGVAVVGDKVIIGAPGDDIAGPDAGAAYLFDLETGQLMRTFLNPSPDADDLFGFRGELAFVGENVLITASRDDTDGLEAGIAYLFDTATGELLHTFHNPTPEEYDRFGRQASTFGNYVLFTVPSDNTGGTDAGSAYLFDASTGALVQTFHNAAPEDGNPFGTWGAFLTNGDVAISSVRDDAGGPDAGVVYVFDAVDTATTDEYGHYTFPDLDPGTYEVREITKPGYVQTTLGGTGTYSLTLSAGENVTGRDFGNVWDSILLFSDSFENGEWNGLWIQDGQNDWFTSTQRATDGSYSAEVDGRATNATLTVANSFDLTPYGSVELKFDWLIESGLDSGEYLAVDVFDGANWTEVAELSGNVDPENTWRQETVDIGASQLVDDFQFRFRAKMNKSDEDANVDNVQLVATSLAGPNNPPDAVDDTATTQEGAAVDVQVLDNDTDADNDALTITAVTDPPNGTVVNHGNYVTYTPDPGYSGPDTFDYTISDGKDGFDTATVSVTVEPAGDEIALYVYEIRFEEKRAGTWRAIFEIHADANRDRDPTNDSGAEGVAITVEFAGQTFSGTTDANGIFTTGWVRKLSSGATYHANVLDLVMANYFWDPLDDILNREDDTDGDGKPDGELTIP